MKLRITSEFGILKRLIMHRPGREIERLNPNNTSELLFEDVPYLEAMQKEHDEFVNLIKNAADAKVYRLKQLLLETIGEEKVRAELLFKSIRKKEKNEFSSEILSGFSAAECVNMLVGGIKISEIGRIKSKSLIESYPENDYVILPSPNLYFMRDPAAIVQGGVISSNMKYSGRQFEPILLRTIFQNHPEFRDHYQQVYPVPDRPESLPTIEGGDVLVISKNALAIGCSERTDREAIQQVADYMLRQQITERVYEVHLPKKRNYMHLDTVFSLIDENLVLCYPEAMEDIRETTLYRAGGKSGEGFSLDKKSINESLLSVLKREIPHLETVETGYGHPDYASREQWYDGANVLALGPRRVISYDRNKHTNRALKDHGVEVLEIRSSELSRGLGGPRCMTLPVERDEIH